MKGKVWLLTLVAAGAASAGVGSVISSFPWGTTVRAIYRDDFYVYGVTSNNFLYTYTTAGSLVRTALLMGLTYAQEADHDLNPLYFDVLDSNNTAKVYVTSTGSLVATVVIPSSSSGYAYAPGGAYYYFLRTTGVYVYTLSGSLVRSFTAYYSSGSLGAATDFNNGGGDYVIVASGGGGPAYVYAASGSPVSSFALPAGVMGAVCGRGAPASYRTTYWINGTSGYAYQLDLGNTAVAVPPWSLGKIKTLLK